MGLAQNFVGCEVGNKRKNDEEKENFEEKILKSARIKDSNFDTELVKKLREVVKFEMMDKNTGIRRDYKLKLSIPFKHFNEFFRSELKTRDLLYVVDEKVKAPEGISKELKENTATKSGTFLSTMWTKSTTQKS